MHNSILSNYSGSNRNRLLYFQLKVDYYSNKANINRYENFHLIASTKNVGNTASLKQIITEGLKY